MTALKSTKIDSMDFRMVPVKDIKIREDKLRKSDTSADNIRMLKQQISEWGQLQPILLLNDEGQLVLDDGLQRLTAMRELGETEILARIVDHDPVESNFIQMVANLGAKQTTGTEYARCLERILAQPEYAGMDLVEVCKRLGINKSESWIRNQLRLRNLCPEAESKVNSGEISTTNAQWLAKLSAENQIMYLEDAQSKKSEDFIGIVEGVLREEKATSRGEDPAEIDPLKGAKLRRMTNIKEQLVEQESKVASLSNIQLDLSQKEQQAAYEAGYLGALQWAVSLDPETIAARDEKKNAIKKMQEEQKEQRKRLMEEQKKMQEALRNNQLDEANL